MGKQQSIRFYCGEIGRGRILTLERVAAASLRACCVWTDVWVTEGGSWEWDSLYTVLLICRPSFSEISVIFFAEQLGWQHL